MHQCSLIAEGQYRQLTNAEPASDLAAFKSGNGGVLRLKTASRLKFQIGN